jgi:hypothetical protein
MDTMAESYRQLAMAQTTFRDYNNALRHYGNAEQVCEPFCVSWAPIWQQDLSFEELAADDY